jgi:ferredoxin
VPAFGDELWLHALALGAQVLVLLLPEGTPIKKRELMRQKVAQVKLVLQAMGQNADRLVCIEAAGLLDWLAQNPAHQARATPAKSSAPALPSWAKFKRLAWIDGIRQLGVLPTAQATSLPQGSCMGKVQVNTARCSLCFACVHVCPSHALLAVNEATPKLVFQESACVQCGLCVRACPEDALNLLPRMAAVNFSQMASVVLHQEAQLKCTACGRPFISRRQLASSLERLKDHAIMQHGGREALITCPSCRQQEMLAT